MRFSPSIMRFPVTQKHIMSPPNVSSLTNEKYCHLVIWNANFSEYGTCRNEYAEMCLFICLKNSCDIDYVIQANLKTRFVKIMQIFSLQMLLERIVDTINKNL